MPRKRLDWWSVTATKWRARDGDLDLEVWKPSGDFKNPGGWVFKVSRGSSQLTLGKADSLTEAKVRAELSASLEREVT